MKTYNDKGKKELFENIDKLHTTTLGEDRVKRNINEDIADVGAWCAAKLKQENTRIERKGKNYYLYAKNCVITINANSYTIITAHMPK